jgi:hypothetical protein
MREARSCLIAYYYFDFKDAAKRDVRGLLTFLLKQLVQGSDHCWDVLYQLYESRDDKSEQPSEAALTNCLKAMLELPGRIPVFIILDALDECPNRQSICPREGLEFPGRFNRVESSKSTHLYHQSSGA